MVDNVVDLDSQRPHTSGPMVCHGCGHTWIGVLMSGTVAADCPKCGHGKGMRAGFVLPDVGTDAFHCTRCADEYIGGCCLFTVYFKDGIIGLMCAHCGHLHDMPTLDDV